MIAQKESGRPQTRYLTTAHPNSISKLRQGDGPCQLFSHIHSCLLWTVIGQMAAIRRGLQ